MTRPCTLCVPGSPCPEHYAAHYGITPQTGRPTGPPEYEEYLASVHALREATDEEFEGWKSGYAAIPGAVETDHGLLVPDVTS